MSDEQNGNSNGQPGPRNLDEAKSYLIHAIAANRAQRAIELISKWSDYLQVPYPAERIPVAMLTHFHFDALEREIR